MRTMLTRVGGVGAGAGEGTHERRGSWLAARNMNLRLSILYRTLIMSGSSLAIVKP